MAILPKLDISTLKVETLAGYLESSAGNMAPMKRNDDDFSSNDIIKNVK